MIFSLRSTFMKYAPIFSILLAFLLLDAQTLLADGHLKIYYLRHGEGGHNVVKEWKDKPKEEWPSYVGNPNIFTPKGDSQVVAVTLKLQEMKFDFIAVSPIWRTRNTILPYLKATNRTAELWPELVETKNIAPASINAIDLPAPSPSLLAGDAIELSKDESPFFTFRDGITVNPKIGKAEEQSSADAIALGKRVVKLIKERFAGSNTSILLVGHGNSGSTLIRLLTGVMDFKALKNTMIWMAEEQSDGSFRLTMFNNEPVKPHNPL